MRVTLQGHTYRSTIALMDGVSMLPVSAEIRNITGLARGDEVDVELELDTAPREVTVPPELAAALNAEPEAGSFFHTLSYSSQQRLVLGIEQCASHRESLNDSFKFVGSDEAQQREDQRWDSC